MLYAPCTIILLPNNRRTGVSPVYFLYPPPLSLSILLIFRFDRFIQEIVLAQKEGYRQILENTKEIHNTITTLNQQNRKQKRGQTTF